MNPQFPMNTTFENSSQLHAESLHAQSVDAETASPVARQSPAPRPGGTLRRILAAVDFTPASLPVLEHASLLAERFGSAVYLLHVVDSGSVVNDLANLPLTRTEDELGQTAANHLVALAQQELPLHVLAKPFVRTGKPAREILRAAAAIRSDLILLGAHQYTGLARLFGGSTIRCVVRAAPCPVLTVSCGKAAAETEATLWDRLAEGAAATPARADEATGVPRSACGLRKILVALDFSDGSKQALRYAAALARDFDGALTLLYVVPSPFARHDVGPANLPASETGLARSCDQLLGDLLRQEAGDSMTGECLMRIGTPDHEIIEAARTLGADLIVLSTRRRNRLSRFLRAGTAEMLLRHPPCPVLTVPADGTARGDAPLGEIPAEQAARRRTLVACGGASANPK